MNIGLRTHKDASLRVAVAEGIPVEMRERVREILSVKSSNPRKGDATALMWTVCAEADKWWITLLAHVKPFDDASPQTMTQEQLQHWYAKFGFVKIQDKADDGTPVVLMARNPQPPVVARIH